MKRKVHEIMINNQYNIVDENLNMYTDNLKSEYFIVKDYSEEQFINFFEDDTTGEIIQGFNKLQGSKGFENLKKNTSLFLLIKVENMKNAYEGLRNQLLLVEEDSYYFRKFVILYTESSLKELIVRHRLSDLYELLSEDIINFEQDMFFNDSYFLAMELAIKLPFFKINKLEKDYETIEEQFKDSHKDYIDEQMLILFNDENNNIMMLSDLEKGNEILVELCKLFTEE